MSVLNLRRVWFEYTNHENLPTPGFVVGEMLRGKKFQGKTPKTQKRMHELMKEVKAGDLVIHVQKEKKGSARKLILGISIVGHFDQEKIEKKIKREIYYEIPLEDFESTRISLNDFMRRNEAALRRELRKGPKKFPFNLRNGKIVLIQNYFSEASRELAEMFVRSGVSPPRRVIDEIASKEAFTLDDFVQSINTAGGQGRGLSGAERRLVENAAMHRAKQWLKEKGFEFQDVHATESCDFRGQLRGVEWVIEVKGTTGGPRSIILTANEVDLHRRSHPRNALLIVHGIQLSKDRSEASGGDLIALEPWTLKESCLTPICYEYRLELEA